MQVTGYPTPEDIESMKSPFAATMLESLPKNRPKPLAEMFPRASSEALDLLRLCFQFNPSRRISAKDSLRHPYVVQFHNPDDEFDCDRVIRIPVDDNTKLRVQDYRDQIYNEVLRKKKEQRRSHRRTLEQMPQAQAAPAQQQVQSSSVQYQQQRTSSKNAGVPSAHSGSGVAQRSGGSSGPQRTPSQQYAPSGGGSSYGQQQQHYQAS